MVTYITRIYTGLKGRNLILKRYVVRAKLVNFRLKRFFLGLKISILSFKNGLFGFKEGKMLSEDRRRAMLVDEFFKLIDKTHVGNP